MTNVLITGCTGFVGSNLAVKLIEKGYNVYGFVRHISKRDLTPLSAVSEKIRIIRGNLTLYHSVCSAISAAQPQYILHLGALTPVRLSFEDPFPYVSANVYGTVNVVHAALEKSPKARLVYASTAEVYGWTEEKKPISENMPLRPASPYAVSKEAADQYLMMATRVYNLNATVLRPNNTYGRRGEKGYLVEYLISSMFKNQTCYVGAPDSIRDYMFIDDHVSSYMLAMESEKAAGEVFNVSPGNPVTNREMANLLAQIVGFRGKMVYGSYPPGYPQRPAEWDPTYLVLDSSKIRRLLNWRPSVTLQEGLKLTVESWKNADSVGS